MMKYIPQAPPFVMIDEIITHSEKQTVTSFIIRKDHLFVYDNKFSEPGLIENMAQTAAAGTGYIAAQKGLKPAVGYIGSIKNWQINSLPSIGDCIYTTTNSIHHIMNAFIVEACIKCNETLIATAEFKIFLQE